MSWTTVIWSMEAAVCLTLAVIYLLVWGRRREDVAYLLFALSAVAAATIAAGELWMMRAETPAQFATALRWLHVPVWVLILALIGFVRLHLRTGRPWLAWTAIGLRTLSLILDFLMPLNLNYREITAVRKIPFLGDTVSVAEGMPNSWMIVGQLSLLLFVAFVVDASVSVWRRGDRRQALFLGGGISVFAVLGTVQAMLVLWEVVESPIIASLLYSVVVVAMGYELSRRVFRETRTALELQESQQHMQLAAASTGLAIWNWDIEHDGIWVSRIGRPFYGVSQDEEISFERFVATLHPDDRTPVRQAAERALGGAGEFSTDYRVVLPEGEVRWFTARGKVEFNGGGKPLWVRGVSLDITGRKLAELELASQRQDLAHLSRVSMLGELAGALAHELNQPLTAVLSNAQAGQRFLAKGPLDMAEITAILDDIATDAKRAGGIIHGMRAMFKKDSQADGQPVDVNESVNLVLNLLHGEIVARKAKVILHLGEGLPLVRAGRVEVQQVLINLVMNSLDAIKSDPRQGSVEITTTRQDGRVIVSVKDTGPGIPAEIMARLFEPFASTKPGGLGLGLAISRSIAERFGGDLLARNQPEGGALFQLVLPVTNIS
ncbi:MAG: ATP-binding protein [Verrucomicrobiota bacterium]